MFLFKRLALLLALLAGLLAGPARAGDTDPLFINLTTDDAHRAAAALTFGLHQQRNGHPLTVFLNDRGALLASRAHAARYAGLQQTLAELVHNGATVLIVPLSMKHYGVAADELLPGLQVSNSQRSGPALFRDNTRTLSW